MTVRDWGLVDTGGHQKAEKMSEDGSDGFSREEDRPSASAKRGSKVRTGSPLRSRKRKSEDDAERVEQERRELAAQLQAEYGEIRWSGPVRLGRREGILLTFDCGLAVIHTQEDRQQAGFLPAEEIAGLNPRVRARSVEIVLKRPADIAPTGSVLIHGRDDQLFRVLETIPRPAPTRSIERPQPTVVRRATNRLEPVAPASSDGLGNPGELVAPDQGRSVGAPRPVDRGQPAGRPGSSDSRRPVGPLGSSAGRRKPVTRRDRGGIEREREGEGRIVARVATAFSPTAYVELPDGVLCPCAWGGTGEPPAVNASVHLRAGASGWVAMSTFDGGSAS